MVRPQEDSNPYMVTKADVDQYHWILQCEAPKIARLVYKPQ